VRTRASFALRGGNSSLTADAVSRKLGLPPLPQVREATLSAAVSTRGRLTVDYQLGPGIEDDVEPDEQLVRLLQVLGPVTRIAVGAC
jgi:hypothetical protein